MKNFLIILFLFSEALFSQNILWQDISQNYNLPGGVKLFKGTRNNPLLIAYYYDVDLNVDSLAVRPYITSQTNTVPVLTKRFGAFAAINGGYFGGTTSYSSVIYPNEVKAPNITALTRNNKSYPVLRSLFSMSADYKFSVDWVYHFGDGIKDVYRFEKPMQYISEDPNPKPVPLKSEGQQFMNLLLGIGGGPTLVKDSQVYVAYNEEIMWGSGVGWTNRDPRTAIGYTDDNHVIMFVADGRLSNTTLGLDLNELAQVMIDLGCIEAMNLDGGGSTQMSAGDKYVNNPSSRSLPSIFAIVHKDSLNISNTQYWESIIDTEDPQVQLFGNGWIETSNPGFYGDSKSLLTLTGNGASFAKYSPPVNTLQECEVYAWWVSASNRSNKTPFIINHYNGIDTVFADQTSNGSAWQYIGKYYFSGDTLESVIISNAVSGNSGKYIVADAMRFVSFDQSVTSIDDNNQLPERSFLDQNYPNPFNPSTNIKYRIMESGNVVINLFDITGSKIRNLVNEFKNPGNYELKFNSKGLPSGVYFYQLKIRGYSQIKKMIILK